MKWSLITLTILFAIGAKGQTTKLYKIKNDKNQKYSVWITTTSPENDLGVNAPASLLPADLLEQNIKTEDLNQFNDLLILLESKISRLPFDPPIKNIHSIKFRRKGRRVMGLLVGTLSGIVTGLVADGFREEKCTVERYPYLVHLWQLEYRTRVVCGKRQSFVPAFGFTGGILGYIIGSQKVTIKIGGNSKDLGHQRKKLEKLLIKP